MLESSAFPELVAETLRSVLKKPVFAGNNITSLHVKQCLWSNLSVLFAEYIKAEKSSIDDPRTQCLQPIRP